VYSYTLRIIIVLRMGVPEKRYWVEWQVADENDILVERET